MLVQKKSGNLLNSPRNMNSSVDQQSHYVDVTLGGQFLAMG